MKQCHICFSGRDSENVNMKTMTIVEVNRVIDYPPVLNLVENLLANGNKVKLISYGNEKLPSIILSHPYFKNIPLTLEEKGDSGKNILGHAMLRKKLVSETKTLVDREMKDSDILWTTSSNTVRILTKNILKYKNVMQLMELMQYGYWYKKLIKYPIDEYARKSWKVVVPEENRAYIQQAWWNLPKTPYVLPNKPYYLEPGILTKEVLLSLEKIKKEKRKILLYLGGIWPDRDLKQFVDAARICGDDYCVYIIGKAYGEEPQAQLDKMLQEENVEYLGYFCAPLHLSFLKYAFIGLLPYRVSALGMFSELNALYCAPNKIYEYAGYGIPMVGTDMLGLKYPFEKYNIGRCCETNNIQSIVSAIKSVESDYACMSEQCKTFYDNTDLDKIVNDIIND